MNKSIYITAIIFLLFSFTDLYAQRSRENSREKYHEDEYEKVETFKVSKGGTLKIDVNPGDVEINTWDKNEVYILVTDIDSDDSEGLKIRKSGNKIIVTYNSHWGWSDSDISATVPKDFNLDIRSTSGDIDVIGDVTGDVKAETSGGDITTYNVTGEVYLNTMGGDIKTGDIKGDLYLNTQGGDIKIGLVSGGKRATINTMGGDIKITEIGTSLDVKTYGGDIRVGDINGEANAVTYGGDIILGNVKAGVDAETYGGNIKLESANGEVKASTYGGNLYLKKVKGSVSAKTNAGKVYVELDPEVNSRSLIRSNMGDIELLIPANTKVTVDAEIKVRGWWKHAKDDYDIHSDFKATNYVQDEDEKEVYGLYEINGGGPIVKIKTTNSKIKIAKMK
ncbi:MAG: DUF4097 family beta strand repeat-containing protein [Ignavibacteria bacterium]|jgi:DUF4097 and DUF4098 domain-containing protein YvlB